MKIGNEKGNVIIIQEEKLRQLLVRMAAYTAYATVLCSTGIIKGDEQCISDIDNEIEKILKELRE